MLLLGDIFAVSHASCGPSLPGSLATGALEQGPHACVLLPASDVISRGGGCASGQGLSGMVASA